MKYRGSGKGLHPAIITMFALLIAAASLLSAWLLLPLCFGDEAVEEGEAGNGWLSKWKSKREARMKSEENSEEYETQGGTDDPGYFDPNGNYGGLLSPLVNFDTKMDGSIGGQAQDEPVFLLYSEKKETVYLQIGSYGDYTGEKWLPIAPYTERFENDLSPRSLTACHILRDPELDKQITLRMLTDVFAVPYYTHSVDHDCIITDTGVEAGTDTEYSFVYGNMNTDWLIEPNPDVALYEEEYRKYVYRHYLKIDDETLAYMQLFMSEHDLVPADGLSLEERIELINKAAAGISRAAGYSRLYNRKLDKEQNIAVAFLETYKEGICSHFATAGTLLFRAMGIPARYTVGFAGETQPGEWAVVGTDRAHAWVEVYLDNIGWICVEVTGSEENSKGTATDGHDGEPGSVTGGKTGIMDGAAGYGSGESSEGGSEGVPGEGPGGSGSGSGSGDGGEEGNNSGKGSGGPGTSGGLNLNGDIGLSGGQEKDTSEEKKPIMLVLSETSDKLYLQIKSFGEYTGHSWDDAHPYPDTMKDGSSARMLAAEILRQTKSESYHLEIRKLMSDFGIPYFTTDINQPCTIEDLLVQAGEDESYEMTYCLFDANDKLFKTADQTFYEENYREFVYHEYLRLDPETRKYMQSVIKANQFQLNQNASLKERYELIERVAAYISKAAVYNMEYDRALDYENNIAIAFLEKYKNGICSHFATAGTVLFRAIGLPARYTIGYVAHPHADQWTAVEAREAHAWVEVYLDGLGWIPVEVTGCGSVSDSGIVNGNMESDDKQEQKKQYKIAPVLTMHKYDGETVYPQQAVTGLAELKKLGYTYSVEIDGSASELGRTTVSITSIKVFDPLGVDITDTLNLKINSGYIHIYYDEIRCTSKDRTEVYNGTVITNTPDDCFIESGELMEGHSIVITPYGEADTVGECPSYFKVEIFDAEGNDCTSWYYVLHTFGKLTMSPLDITIKAMDAKKTYDGMPLTAPEYEITGGALAPGDRITQCAVVGEQTQIGRCDNVIDIGSIRIENENGEDVTCKYHIITVKGTLRVTN